MDKNKYTKYDKTLLIELEKLNISQQVFDEVCEISAAFSEEHKELSDSNYPVFFILMLTYMYDIGLKGGAV